MKTTKIVAFISHLDCHPDFEICHPDIFGHPERSEVSLRFALTFNSNRKSHPGLIMFPHLTRNLVPSCFWKGEIRFPY